MTPREQWIRAMRDRVFASTSSDANWLGCRDAWLTPSETAWLVAECAKLDKQEDKPCA